MSELARKLGLRTEQLICLLDAPEAGGAAVREACLAGSTVETALGASQFDTLFFWPTALDGLAERFAVLQAHIAPNGAIWVVLPKKAVARQRGITFTWEQMQVAALTTDLVDNKIVSLTSEEYATRFVIRRARRMEVTS